MVSVASWSFWSWSVNKTARKGVEWLCGCERGLAMETADVSSNQTVLMLRMNKQHFNFFPFVRFSSLVFTHPNVQATLIILCSIENHRKKINSFFHTLLLQRLFSRYDDLDSSFFAAFSRASFKLAWEICHEISLVAGLGRIEVLVSLSSWAHSRHRHSSESEPKRRQFKVFRGLPNKQQRQEKVDFNFFKSTL